MPEIARLLLLAMAWLLVKHYLADFLLQSAYQYRNKGRYLHPGGLLHSLIHVALTAPVFLLLPPAGLAAAGLILGAEFLVHYHVDWAKEAIGRMRGLTPSDGAFWHFLGLDQMLHGLTYVAIVWVLLTPDLAVLI